MTMSYIVTRRPPRRERRLDYSMFFADFDEIERTAPRRGIGGRECGISVLSEIPAAAGRKSSIKHYPSKNGFFTIYQGKTYRLATGPDDWPSGPTFLTALKEFRRVLDTAHAPTYGDGNRLGIIAELYLKHLAETKKSDTVRIRQQNLGYFLE